MDWNTPDKAVESFMKAHGMHAVNVDFAAECQRFRDEMKAGLASQQSTLHMLPTYVRYSGTVSHLSPVVTVDIGGTNLRVAVVRFDKEHKASIEKLAISPTPGSRGAISKDEFFDTVAGSLKPLMDESDILSVCFSFAAENLPDGDGRLLYLDKEVVVDGLAGEKIGEGIIRSLRRMGMKGEKKFILINDTVTALLSGMQQTGDYDAHIGFIWGTGTNTCYPEFNRNILKEPALRGSEGRMLINMESGGYGKAPAGDFDRVLDAESADPGAQQFEKKISGVYLGKIGQKALEGAVAEGLLSVAFGAALQNAGGISTPAMCSFLDDPEGYALFPGRETLGDADKRRAYLLLDAVAQRAAKLVAVNLAAVLKEMERGSDPKRPVCVTVEGSTYHKCESIKKKLQVCIREYLNQGMGLYCDLIKVENGSLIGTAMAGLTLLEG